MGAQLLEDTTRFALTLTPVVCFGTVMIALSLITALVIPDENTRRVGAPVAIGALVILMVIRVWLSRLADTSRARLIFSCTWAALSISSCIFFGVRRRVLENITTHDIPAPRFLVGMIMWVFHAAYMRHVAVLAVARWSILVSTTLALASYRPPLSTLGGPLETLALCAAQLFGEFIGWLFELRWRSLLHTQHLATRLEAQPPPVPSEAAHVRRANHLPLGLPLPQRLGIAAIWLGYVALSPPNRVVNTASLLVLPIALLRRPAAPWQPARCQSPPH